MKNLETGIEKELASLLAKEGFSQLENFEKFERWAFFSKRVGEFNYHFDLRFLYNGDGRLSEIEPWIKVDSELFQQEILRLKKAETYKNTNKLWPAFSTRIGSFILLENQSRVWKNRESNNLKLNTDRTNQDIIDELFFMYYLEGFCKFVEETKTIKKLNSILNDWCGNDDTFPRTTYFVSINNQLLIALMAAHLSNNSNFEKLVFNYKSHGDKLRDDNIPIVNDLLSYIDLFYQASD